MSGRRKRDQVADIRARSCDAEYILEEEEFDLLWTEEERPISWFRVNGGQSIESCAETFNRQDRERIAYIEEWAAECGGLWEAIHKSPILALENGDVLDGAHRLVTAFLAGLRTVTVLVGHQRGSRTRKKTPSAKP